MKRYVYDIEIFRNYFCIVFMDYDTQEFTVYDSNSTYGLKQLLKGKPWLIGYNSLHFDDVILSYILKGKDCKFLYDTAQAIITEEKYFRSKKSWFSIDIMKMLFSKKLRVSLKSMEVALLMDTIEDLPFHHTKYIEACEHDTIISYCKNDVLATYLLTKRNEDKLNLRSQVYMRYDLNGFSYDDVKLGSEIVRKLYLDKHKVPKEWTVKPVCPKELIFKHIKFKTKEFRKVFDFYNVDSIELLREKHHGLYIGGIALIYGLGGLHGCITDSKVVEPEHSETLYDTDATSYYPSTIAKYGLYPAHLHPYWNELYISILQERVKAKANKDMLWSDTYKLSLNGSGFGMLNSKYSWVYDPSMFYTITINCQLMMSMLIEELVIKKFKIIMANTDGIQVIVPKDREEEYNRICNAWQSTNRINLEHEPLKKIVISDVNNYLAVYEDNNIKLKGAKYKVSNILGKGYKYPIVQKAIIDYYINGKPVEETIKECDDIHQFVIMARMGKSKDGSYFQLQTNEGILQGRTFRYYVSTNGSYAHKVTSTRKISLLNKPIRVINELPLSLPEDIDYEYYIHEAKEIINNVAHTQLNLFS